MAQEPELIDEFSIHEKRKRVLADFAAGTVGGILQTFVGHPLDTIKVRLQTQKIDAFGKGKYSGVIHCLRCTLREERIFGLYKGLLSPLTGLAFLNAILFTSYGYAKDFFTNYGEHELTAMQSMACGAFAGAAQCVIVCPMELIKTRLQAQYNYPTHTTPEYTGNIDCIKKTVKTRGVKGLYSGMYGCLIRELPAYAVCFPAFEVSQELFAKLEGRPKDEISPASVIIAGGIAGVACWTISYPQDIVLNRLRVQRVDEPPIYKTKMYDGGFWDCFWKLYRKEGLRGFTKGFSACAFRAFPANAASFYGYSITKDFLS
uniref:Mitochondrial carrier protein n=1 Tax=Paramoeba aestuarina TaxID=180227 RepID=A0A7S4KHV2_9EUKA|mmetsp:Transcript_19397/g.30386  ORF Transcript_19397/g.30386 Transcript_19397/m.30386 type:complete len:317 (+) Transcript_19397:179-1129(+)